MSESDDQDDDHKDGCLCDLQPDESIEFTTDEDLPEASGGVDKKPAPGQTHSDDLDGCDLDFRTGDLMADADLPPSVGGVA